MLCLLSAALVLGMVTVGCGGAAENSEGIGAVNATSPATTTPSTTAADVDAAALDRLAEMEEAGMTPAEVSLTAGAGFVV